MSLLARGAEGALHKTTYINSPIHLTESQLRKLKLNEPCTVRIDPSKKANYHLCLTQTQVNQLNNVKSVGTSKDLNKLLLLK